MVGTAVGWVDSAEWLLRAWGMIVPFRAKLSQAGVVTRIRARTAQGMVEGFQVQGNVHVHGGGPRHFLFCSRCFQIRQPELPGRCGAVLSRPEALRYLWRSWVGKRLLVLQALSSSGIASTEMPVKGAGFHPCTLF